jgi:hypothetical protein
VAQPWYGRKEAGLWAPEDLLPTAVERRCCQDQRDEIEPKGLGVLESVELEGGETDGGLVASRRSITLNVQVLLELARRIGPQAAKLIVKWAPTLLDRRNRQLLEQVGSYLKRGAMAKKGRSRSERLRRTLKVVQEQAHELAQRQSDDEARSHQARQWIEKADSLLGALALLKVRNGSQRRTETRRIGEEADALFAAVMEATMSWDSPRPTAEELQGVRDGRGQIYRMSEPR